MRGNKIAPLRHAWIASLSTYAKGVQFYCPSRTYPAIPYCTTFPFLAHYVTVTSAAKVILKRPTTLDLKCKSKPRNGSNSSKCKYMGTTTCLYHGPHRKTSLTASKNWRTSSSTTDSSSKKSNIFVRLTSLSRKDPNHHVVTSLTSKNMKESPKTLNDPIGKKHAF